MFGDNHNVISLSGNEPGGVKHRGRSFCESPEKFVKRDYKMLTVTAVELSHSSGNSHPENDFFVLDSLLGIGEQTSPSSKQTSSSSR